MKILIPTAKELNLDQPAAVAQAMNPSSQAVLDSLASYSPAQLAVFYKLSPEKAELEYQRIQDLADCQTQHYPALQLFDGLMYRHIKRQDLTQAEEDYLGQRVLITSALYGVIPAFYPIAPHRLDFQMKLTLAGQSLKSFWRADFDQALAGQDLILSLLSNEFETVFSKSVRERMVTVKFMEEKAGQLKVHSTISKKARGAFLTALMTDHISQLEQIKSLTFAGFEYEEEHSSDKELVFIKRES